MNFTNMTKNNGKSSLIGFDIGKLNYYRYALRTFNFVTVQFCDLTSLGGYPLNHIFAILLVKGLSNTILRCQNLVSTGGI